MKLEEQVLVNIQVTVMQQGHIPQVQPCRVQARTQDSSTGLLYMAMPFTASPRESARLYPVHKTALAGSKGAPSRRSSARSSTGHPGPLPGAGPPAGASGPAYAPNAPYAAGPARARAPMSTDRRWPCGGAGGAASASAAACLKGGGSGAAAASAAAYAWRRVCTPAGMRGMFCQGERIVTKQACTRNTSSKHYFRLI